ALKTPAIFDGKEHKWKNFWGGYLLLSGIILVMLYPHEWFFGSWVAICAIAIFLLGSSWWAQKYEQPSRRWRIIDRTALILTILVWLSGTIIFPVYYDRDQDTLSQRREELIKELRRRHVPWTEYAGLRLGMSPDEVMQIRGDPPFVIGKEKIAEDVFPTFEIKTLKNGERVQDYQGWHWPDFEGGINVFFDPERKAVIANRVLLAC